MIELLLAISLLAEEPQRDHVCVVGEHGGWLCGDARRPPPPATLPPDAQARETAPPVLLIDPARFQLIPESRQSRALPVQTPVNRHSASHEPLAKAGPTEPTHDRRTTSDGMVAEAPPAPAQRASVPSPAPLELGDARVNPRAAREQRARAMASAVSPMSSIANGRGFVVQLALARNADGFPALIQRLGLSKSTSEANAAPRVLRVRRDGQIWFALCLGPYASMQTARKAIPAGAPDAFARPMSDYQLL